MRKILRSSWNTVKIFCVFWAFSSIIFIFIEQFLSKEISNIIDTFLEAIFYIMIIFLIFSATLFLSLKLYDFLTDKMHLKKLNLPKFKNQIQNKLISYKKNPLYINLSLTIKDVYSSNFNYNFHLPKNKIDMIFEFIYLNIKSDLNKNKDDFLLGYENHFKDYDLRKAQMVAYFASLMNIWEKIQNLIFEKLNFDNKSVDEISKKVWDLFVKCYINVYTPATLKRQKGPFAIQIYKNLLIEILEQNHFLTAESALEKTNKEKREQTLFEIYKSKDKELLEIYLYDTFYVGKFLRSWQKRQMLFEENRLFYDLIDCINKGMIESYAKNPLKFSKLSQNEAKNEAKNILKNALFKSGFVPLKTPLRNGLEILTYDNTPDFLRSFDFYLDLFCYKFMDEKTKNFKDICYENLKTELNSYSANWLLQKDGEFGKKLFYQILPIALNKI